MNLLNTKINKLKGMTLVEIVVTIAIFSSVLIIGSSSLVVNYISGRPSSMLKQKINQDIKLVNDLIGQQVQNANVIDSSTGLIITGYRVPPNYGLNFDGADDYVNTTTPITNYASTQDQSYSAWVNYSTISTGSNYTIISNGAADISSGSNLILNKVGSSMFIGLKCNSTPPRIVNSTTPLTSGTWHHIVASYSQSTNQVAFYLDGNSDGVSNVNGSWPSGTSSIMLVRSSYNPFPYYYNGQLDDLRIYNKALTNSDVANIYNSGNVSNINTISGLTGWWKFNDGNGANTYDGSGSALTGTLLNGSSNSPAADGKTYGPIWTVVQSGTTPTYGDSIAFATSGSPNQCSYIGLDSATKAVWMLQENCTSIHNVVDTSTFKKVTSTNTNIVGLTFTNVIDASPTVLPKFTLNIKAQDNTENSIDLRNTYSISYISYKSF